jgi:hypothetical protein
MIKFLNDNDLQPTLKKHSQFKVMELEIFRNSKYVPNFPNFKSIVCGKIGCSVYDI